MPNICPITYENVGGDLYSLSGLSKLHRGLQTLADFPYTAEEQRAEAIRRATKMSIQGIQPKLSAIFDSREGGFLVVDSGGKYILKPGSLDYPELPENEDLSMRLALAVGIPTPFHGLVYAKDRSLVYFIQRFDRAARGRKIPVEDFAQLAGKSRDTKYNYSVEKVITLIDQYCTFPALAKADFFKRFLFNFLIGNEDMHLKNYSVIRSGPTFEMVELAPAYDFVNSTLALPGAEEESALPLNGKKSNLSRSDFLQYLYTAPT